VQGLGGREVGFSDELLKRGGVTFCDLVAVDDVRLTLDLERCTVGFRLGDLLDLERLTLGGSGLLGLLCLGDAVVRLAHLIGEHRVVDDDLVDHEAVARDLLGQVLGNRCLDAVAVFVDLFERHQGGPGLDLVAD